MAAGVNAYLIKSDVAKLDVAEMAHYLEERIGNTITTAWNLNVKDVEQTISGVCQRVRSPLHQGNVIALCVPFTTKPSLFLGRDKYLAVCTSAR